MSLKATKYLVNFIGIVLMSLLAIKEINNVTKLVDCCPLYDMEVAQKEAIFPVFEGYIVLVIIGNLIVGKLSGQKWKKEFVIIVCAQIIILVFLIFFQTEYIKYYYNLK
ncbi:hypothetical protein [Flavobacterium sp.]|uniref:hypothetical protein n=1 Tax=Flavobacterium sp. TaxID=239 RepID=UPI0035AF2B0F